jgi:hypothetical protein
MSLANHDAEKGRMKVSKRIQLFAVAITIMGALSLNTAQAAPATRGELTPCSENDYCNATLDGQLVCESQGLCLAMVLSCGIDINSNIVATYWCYDADGDCVDLVSFCA